MANLRFPDGFLWGVATSAHQIEGGNVHSDWWNFEKLPGRVKNGEHSGRACDHWNRLEEDVGLMKELGIRSYRFTVEWAKLEPLEGEIAPEALEHYQRLIRLLREAGIEPMITLHHFTSPRWFRDRGAWDWGEAPRVFSGYAKLVLERIAPQCKLWCTINEPMVHLGGGYVAGLTPPEKRDFSSLRAPLLGLLRSHAAAYRMLHSLGDVSVGMAHHLHLFAPKRRWNPVDQLLAKSFHEAFNWTIPDALESGRVLMRIRPFVSIEEELPELAGTQDYFGMNYYTRDQLTLGMRKGRVEPVASAKRGRPVSDLGWEIYPEGFRRVLDETILRAPGRPIYITENGIADREDLKRPEFLQEHLRVLQKASADGIPVKGYYHWSLMDNFEWIEGFGPRFGLYEVDYRTMERRARPSAGIYSRIVRRNGIELRR